MAVLKVAAEAVQADIEVPYPASRLVEVRARNLLLRLVLETRPLSPLVAEDRVVHRGVHRRFLQSHLQAAVVVVTTLKAKDLPVDQVEAVEVAVATRREVLEQRGKDTQESLASMTVDFPRAAVEVPDRRVTTSTVEMESQAQSPVRQLLAPAAVVAAEDTEAVEDQVLAVPVEVATDLTTATPQRTAQQTLAVAQVATVRMETTRHEELAALAS